jgi:hypothetical protein
MAKIVTANTLLSKHVTRRDRVLLLNPPVEETRYSWLRWNQPLDLLKLASLLRSQVECGVELLDCMKPDPNGKVAGDKAYSAEWLRVAVGAWHRAGHRPPAEGAGPRPAVRQGDVQAAEHHRAVRQQSQVVPPRHHPDSR